MTREGHLVVREGRVEVLRVRVDPAGREGEFAGRDGDPGAGAPAGGAPLDDVGGGVPSRRVVGRVEAGALDEGGAGDLHDEAAAQIVVI